MITKEQVEKAEKEYKKIRDEIYKESEVLLEKQKEKNNLYSQLKNLEHQLEQQKQTIPDKGGFLDIAEEHVDSGYRTVYTLDGKRINDKDELKIKMNDGTELTAIVLINAVRISSQESIEEELYFKVKIFGSDQLIKYKHKIIDSWACERGYFESKIKARWGHK